MSSELETEVVGAPEDYGVEEHSVDFIPPEDRYWKAWRLGPFWFASNQQFLTVVTGLLAIVLGLNLLWAIVAIVVGNLFGAIFMAYHSAQGPKLGIPQMIQSRAQFGFYGAFFVIAAAFFLQFGYFASTVALSGETLNALSSSISTPLGIVLISVPILALAVFGYRWIHYWQLVATAVFAVAFVIATIQVLTTSRALPAGSFSTAAPHWAIFLVVVSIAATYQISWAPFVSDYSRYLPEKTRVSSTFWWTYGGSVISCIWLEILGCLVVLLFPKATTVGAFSSVSGRWILFVLAVSLIGAAATNLYCGMMDLITLVNTWRPIRPSVALRIGGIVATLIVGLVVALTGYRSFLTNFTNFLLVLLFVFVPWTAVNLTDFYLIRHGRYDTRSFFTPRGIYGRWSWQGLVAYFVGLAVEIPFIDQTFYTGPLAKSLGGADISWILGIVVSGTLYYVLARRFRPAMTAEVPAEVLETRRAA
jgi:nucleobase:cation symporter-1, NCS1 family